MPINEIVRPISVPTWQKALNEAISQPEELFDYLQLDPHYLAGAKQANELFHLRVPKRFVDKMEPGNIYDPLLRQVLPLGEETEDHIGFTPDPLSEKRFNPLPGVLHKYHSRILVTLTGACAVNCRYCFRRHFPYTENVPGKKGREKIVEYVNERPYINEIILSGGDPLLADDDYLQEFMEPLQEIEHVKRLRIHTRLPVMLPERVTPEMLQWLANLDVKTVVVLHINHPKELDQEIAQAVQCLKNEADATVLNQAVILKDVNDSIDTQVELNESLFDHGILPYYLHLLDKVQGAAHFAVDDDTITDIYQGMQEQLPGYLLPKLTTEIPGVLHKVIIGNRSFDST